MGNGVGKVIGVIAGAAASCIPGVGPVAGALIFAATTGAGSGVDALVDTNRQNNEADKAAAAAKIAAAKQLEEERQKAVKNLEDSLKKAHEDKAALDFTEEQARIAALQAAANAEVQARRLQQQMGFLEQSFIACDTENFNALPQLLVLLDNEHFEFFSQGALARCQTADALENCRTIMEHEQFRREISEGWDAEISALLDNAVAGNEVNNRPRIS